MPDLCPSAFDAEFCAIINRVRVKTMSYNHVPSNMYMLRNPADESTLEGTISLRRNGKGVTPNAYWRSVPEFLRECQPMSPSQPPSTHEPGKSYPPISFMY